MIWNAEVEGETHWQVPVIARKEGNGEVEVVLRQQAGLEVGPEELFCSVGGGECVVKPALGEGHGGSNARSKTRTQGRGRDWIASGHVTASGPWAEARVPVGVADEPHSSPACHRGSLWRSRTCLPLYTFYDRLSLSSTSNCPRAYTFISSSPSAHGPSRPPLKAPPAPRQGRETPLPPASRLRPRLRRALQATSPAQDCP